MRHYLVPYNRNEEDDPLFDEFTYGHQESRLNKVQVGEYLFFHTKVLEKRYITAYYQVFEKKSVKEIRQDPYINKKYRNHHIFNGNETDIVIFGHPVYSYILEKPLLLSPELLYKLVGDKKVNQGKLIMNFGAEEELLKLIDDHQQMPLHEVSLTTEDIYHLREKDIEDLLCNNPKLLGENLTYLQRQKSFDDKSILDVLLTDDKDLVIVEIKKGLINQDVYSQIKGYINNLKIEKPNQNVRGIIVCRGFDSEQSKNFYTEKISKGKIEVFVHAWKFDLKMISALDLLNV
ncbi:endonuclease NucS domain-containing protein [Bacillus ndiopicus]|uniref:endonuclease NucS domain-containing protein n=1 Tax=Bacillus ndiopicus TaxID=1347368 RepID=UPI000694C448|nr:endonuclease NucS domain-containing protein [Bacillus ndiopicus]